MIEANQDQPEMISQKQVVLTMSIREAAKITGVGRSQFYAAVQRGEIPSMTFGSRTRVLTVPFMRKLKGE